MRKVLIGTFVLAALTVLLLSGATDTTEAARGGGGGGGKPPRGSACATCVLAVTPNPVPLGSQSVDISGTGFGASQYLVVTVPGACCDMGVTTDTTGAFTATFYRNFDWASTYGVEILRDGVKVASTTFTVQ